MTDDEDVDVWITRTRRRNALRVLALGALLAAGGLVCLFTNLDFESIERIAPMDMGDGTTSPELIIHHRADPRLIGGAIAAVGISAD